LLNASSVDFRHHVDCLLLLARRPKDHDSRRKWRAVSTIAKFQSSAQKSDFALYRVVNATTQYQCERERDRHPQKNLAMMKLFKARGIDRIAAAACSASPLAAQVRGFVQGFMLYATAKCWGRHIRKRGREACMGVSYWFIAGAERPCEQNHLERISSCPLFHTKGVGPGVVAQPACQSAMRV
jgi:hypothetical protein